VSLANSISSEASRAGAAETVLTNNLSSEVSRAKAAETSLGVSLSTEVSMIVAGDYEFATLKVAGNIYGSATDVSISGTYYGNAFQTTSDARLKTDVEEVLGATEKVRALHPVFYNWVDGHAGINPGHKEIGFLAQEIEAVLPNVVCTDNTEFAKKGVAYDRVVSLLVAAVKELDARVTTLETA
jgi:hypothetical protein